MSIGHSTPSLVVLHQPLCSLDWRESSRIYRSAVRFQGQWNRCLDVDRIYGLVPFDGLANVVKSSFCALGIPRKAQKRDISTIKKMMITNQSSTSSTSNNNNNVPFRIAALKFAELFNSRARPCELLLVFPERSEEIIRNALSHAFAFPCHGQTAQQQDFH